VSERSTVKLESHDTDTDTDILARILTDTSDTCDFLKLFLWQTERHADIFATILARMSARMSASVSASWNSSFTPHRPLMVELTLRVAGKMRSTSACPVHDDVDVELEITSTSLSRHRTASDVEFQLTETAFDDRKSAAVMTQRDDELRRCSALDRVTE